VPNALNSPILIDIGFQRPSISINGTFSFTRNDAAGASRTCTYYFPYKNILETAATTWIYKADNELELEIGDISTATGHISATGGGLYKVAIQQCRFQIDAAKEDRWTFALQFVAKSRDDIVFGT